MRSIIRRYEDDRKREKEQEFALERIRAEAAGRTGGIATAQTGALARQGMIGKQGLAKQELEGTQAMGLQGLRGRQAMDVAGLREAGATSRARLGQTEVGAAARRKLIDLPVYDESRQFQIGTTPGLLDMETGEYAELRKKKKKKKSLSEMTLEELYQEQTALGH